MSLLAPLFLLGALAIVGPIVAHLVRRNTRDRVAFSATQFLDPSAPRLDRRNRIEHPWLLLLRVLAVLVLVLGFARPFFRETPAPLHAEAPVRHRVIVLDASASMQREGLFAAALARAQESAGELGAADSLAILAAGSSAASLLSVEQWIRTAPADRASLIREVLAAQQPGWTATHLDDAVERALDELAAMREATAPTEATIVVVSDFAEGARISGLAGREWPDGVRVHLDSVARPGEPNASLHWLGWSDAPDGSRQARLRVAHEAFDSRHYRLTLTSVDGAQPLAEPLEVILAPRESRAVTLPFDAEALPTARADLTGDTERFDNTVWIAAPAPRRFVLSYWGRGDASDPASSLYYISRAVRGWREPAMTVLPAPGESADRQAAPLHIVAQGLSATETAQLRQQAEAGAFVLVLVHDAATRAAAAALAGEPEWAANDDDIAENLLLADIAFAHPLFAPFADPRYSDFSRIRFWRVPRLTVPAGAEWEHVARFDDGSPAILEKPIGRGALVLWAGDWTPNASQWVLSTKFVPWLQILAQRAVGGPAVPTMAEVGNPSALRLPADAPVPERPGVISVPGSASSRTVALNLPPAESRTAPLSLDAWETLGVPLTDRRPANAAAATREPRAGSAAAARLEAEQRLWRWLLLAAAGVLALESILAIRATGRPSPGTVPNPT